MVFRGVDNAHLFGVMKLVLCSLGKARLTTYGRGDFGPSFELVPDETDHDCSQSEGYHHRNDLLKPVMLKSLQASRTELELLS